MPSESASSRPERRTRKWVWALLLLLIGGSALWLWNSDMVLFPQRHTSTVLVLDNCDDDFRTPPFEDALICFGPNGKASRILTNLNTCQTVGGSRCLASSEDGKFAVVCEIVGKHLIACEPQTGRKLWSLDGEFTAATVAPDRRVYAVISAGTIYGDRTVAIENGRIINQSMNAGFDMALDSARKVLWLVGKTIKKCDLELNALLEITPIKWCAASVDVNSDGSIWVVERDHPNVLQSTNRILKISPAGEILKTVNLRWNPLCVRVDPSDQAVWVTGVATREPMTKHVLNWIERKIVPLPIGKKARDLLTKTRVSGKSEKFDQNGKLLLSVPRGGHSLDIDRADSSIWLAGKDKIYHYSRGGKKLGRFGGVSSDQKYIVVISGLQGSKKASIRQ